MLTERGGAIADILVFVMGVVIGAGVIMNTSSQTAQASCMPGKLLVIEDNVYRCTFLRKLTPEEVKDCDKNDKNYTCRINA